MWLLVWLGRECFCWCRSCCWGLRAFECAFYSVHRSTWKVTTMMAERTLELCHSLCWGSVFLIQQLERHRQRSDLRGKTESALGMNAAEKLVESLKRWDCRRREEEKLLKARWVGENHCVASRACFTWCRQSLAWIGGRKFDAISSARLVGTFKFAWITTISSVASENRCRTCCELFIRRQFPR